MQSKNKCEYNGFVNGSITHQKCFKKVYTTLFAMNKTCLKIQSSMHKSKYLNGLEQNKIL